MNFFGDFMEIRDKKSLFYTFNQLLSEKKSKSKYSVAFIEMESQIEVRYFLWMAIKSNGLILKYSSHITFSTPLSLVLFCVKLNTHLISRNFFGETGLYWFRTFSFIESFNFMEFFICAFYFGYFLSKLRKEANHFAL